MINRHLPDTSSVSWQSSCIAFAIKTPSAARNDTINAAQRSRLSHGMRATRFFDVKLNLETNKKIMQAYFRAWRSLRVYCFLTKFIMFICWVAVASSNELNILLMFSNCLVTRRKMIFVSSAMSSRSLRLLFKRLFSNSLRS